MSRGAIEIDDRRIEVTHADRVLFPESGLTKADIACYYRRIAPVALPHYRSRALTMQRFPDGIEGEGFFQKHVPGHFPDWILRVTLPKEDGHVTHLVANDAATLVYLANFSCITPHLALARVDRPDHPDRLVFDLDPSDEEFRKVQGAAKHLKDLLDRLDMPVFVQTTGSRGLHLVVPLDRTADFDTTREFARCITSRLAREHPDELTIEHRKSKRGRRVFLDDLRNAYGQTAVAPYAVRARPHAPVATPLHWREAGASSLHPRKYTIRNIFRRLAQTQDPWRDMGRRRCSIKAARRRFDRL